MTVKLRQKACPGGIPEGDDVVKEFGEDIFHLNGRQAETVEIIIETDTPDKNSPISFEMKIFAR